MVNRRKFIGMASVAATAGLTIGPAFAGEQTQTRSTGQISDAKVVVPAVDAVQQIAEIIETKVICREEGRLLGQGTEYSLNINGHVVVGKRVIEPNRYLGWPTITKTAEGELVVAFSGDRDAHVCPWGKTQIIRSSDEGKSWTDARTITSTPLDDRDAGIIQTAKGTLLVSWFTSLAFENPVYESAYNKYLRVGEKIPEETRKEWLGNWTRRSEDNGKTWLTPVRTAGTAPHGPVQLRDGRLLYIGIGKWGNDKGSLIVEESADDGRSWNIISNLPRPEGLTASWSEPHLLELKSGKIIAMIRHEPRDTSQCFLLQSESLDGGKTWTELHQTKIWGYPPHLTQLANGWIVVVYGYRREPFGERACISRDEGRTWDIANEIVLSNAASRDLGYPSSVQLKDGSILTVYYQAEKFGQPTSLLSTHWRIK